MFRRSLKSAQHQPSRQLEALEHRHMLDGTVLINEIYIDPPAGGDVLYEYLELRGPANMSLDGYYFIAIENENNIGNTGATGTLDMVYNLSGKSLGSNGFLVVTRDGHPFSIDPQSNEYHFDGPLLENSGATYMVIKNVSGTAPTQGEDLDVGNDGLDVPTGKVGWEISDSIGIFSEAGEAQFGRLYGKVNFGPEDIANVPPDAVYQGTNFEIEYVGRWGDSTGSSVDDWNVSNLTSDPLSGFTDTGDFRQSGDPQAAPTVVESSHDPQVPYGTNMTNTLGATNYPGIITPPNDATIVGRQIFYNQSKFDGNNAQVTASDDLAIAPGKTAYVPGSGPATFANISSFTRGINGVMVDLQGTHGEISASDFIFKTGNNNTPSLWATAPAPVSVVVRAGAGVSGSDRIGLIWGADAVKNSWLEVIVKGNDATGGSNTNTGLAASSIFFFGSRVGDEGSGTAATAVTNSTDEISARNNGGLGVSITSLYDYDRNGAVQSTDAIAARNNGGFTIKINLANPPAAPEVAPLAASNSGQGDSGEGDKIAAGLSLLAKVPAIKFPTWIADRLASVDLNSGPIAQVFTNLAESGNPRAKSLLVAANKVTDKLGLDDWLLESLIDDLGL